MTPGSRSWALFTSCLVLWSCSATGPVTGTNEPLQASDEPQTTTSQAGAVPMSLASLDWSTVGLEFGVSQITEWRSRLVGLAVQDFDAPSSLIDEDDTGCVGFQAGRTGEVVWSTDGVEWETLPAQPYWYEGPLTPQDWGEIVRAGGIPSYAGPVELVPGDDRLLAVSFDELTETRAGAVVDAFDPRTERWDRLGSLGSVGFNRSAVAAASGPEATIIMAAGPDRDLTVWTVTEAGLDELTRPFAGLLVEPDEQWSAQVDGVELTATIEGFIAQFEVASLGPVMAYSVDGTQWTRVAHPGEGPVQLAASGTTVLGWNGDGTWISVDHGESWRAAQLEQATQLIDLGGTRVGFLAWTFEETWVSPAVWHSRDGVEWERVLELSDEHNWVNGLLMTEEAIVVSASVPSDGWVCPEIEHYEYEIHIGRFE